MPDRASISPLNQSQAGRGQCTPLSSGGTFPPTHTNRDDPWICWRWVPVVVSGPEGQNILARASGTHEPCWPVRETPVQHRYLQFTRLPMALQAGAGGRFRLAPWRKSPILAVEQTLLLWDALRGEAGKSLETYKQGS